MAYRLFVLSVFLVGAAGVAFGQETQSVRFNEGAWTYYDPGCECNVVQGWYVNGYQLGQLDLNLVITGGAVSDGWYQIHVTRESNDAFSGGTTSYFDAWVYPNSNSEWDKGYDVDQNVPMQSWDPNYTNTELGDSTTVYTVTGVDYWPPASRTAIALSVSGTPTSEFDGSHCNLYPDWTLCPALESGTMIVENVLTVEASYARPTSIQGHFYGVVRSSCCHDRTLTLYDGSTELTTVSIPGGSYANIFQYDGNVTVGDTYSYVLTDGEHSIPVASGFIAVNQSGGEYVGDFYADDAFFDIRCDSDCATPSATPTPSVTATPSATPTGSPEPTPTGTAGGGSSPTSTPGGTPLPSGHVWVDGDSYTTPSDQTFVPIPTPSVPDIQSATDALASAASSVTPEAGRMTLDVSNWATASFGTATTFPVPVGTFLSTMGFPSGVSDEYPVPAVASTIREIFRWILLCAFFVLTVSSIVGVKDK